MTLARERDPALFDARVAQCTVRFGVADDPSVLAAVASIRQLPDGVARAVTKRRNEFIAGRYCARTALAGIDATQPHATIDVGASREPIFPRGIVGAITHIDGLASAAIARAADLRGVGIDMERWISEDTVREVRDPIGTPSEYAALVEQSRWTLAEVVTLVFSFKESIYKCLFPSVGRYFDFLDAEVISVDPATRTCRARLLDDLSPSLRRGTLLEGRFERGDEYLATGLALARDGAASA